MLVETRAAREAALHRPRSAIEQMKASMVEYRAINAAPRTGGPRAIFTDYRAILAVDSAFHHALLDATGNRLIARTYRDLNPHLHFGRIFLAAPEAHTVERAVPDTIQEHQDILDAVENGDAGAAAAAMRRHLDCSRARVEEGEGQRAALTPSEEHSAG
jgi:DNA-binding GntR family transcriptional regulator